MEYVRISIKRWIALSAVALTLLSAGTLQAQEEKLKNTQGAQIQNNNKAKQSQEKVTKVANETKELLDEYRATLRKIENTKIYNEQMRKLINSQDQEMVSIAEQIEEIKDTNKNIVPLMIRMIANLKEFVKLDVPFLPDERQRRLSQLEDMMDKAKVSTSEKFRRILEAYQIENEYGRTIESYKGIQTVDGKELTVNYLRTGRLSLVYQTLDGKTQGQWDHINQKWVPLSSSYRKSINQGIKMAKKQAAPDLIKVPVAAPQEVQVEAI